MIFPILNAFDEILIRNIAKLPPFTFVLLSNIRQFFLLRFSTRFYYSKKNQSFYSVEGSTRIYFFSKYRQVRLYSRGLKKRIRLLAKDYFVESIPIRNGDNIIDCGANIGEFYYALMTKSKNFNYFGFEPSPIEYKNLELNIPFRNNYQIALSDISKEETFYLSSEEADSSLIKPNYFSKTIKVGTKRLDEIFKDKHIRLLKLEAEGAEIEVLKGCKNILPNIDYISADLGPERGVNSEPTYSEVLPYLINNGFILEKISNRRFIFLFRNSKCNN
tara:strand:- start:825 stop:1649 length:825 start_codon:yes stop_codon:yes gene_type:complete